MSNRRVIKKYPNRRLYDTAESRYITLADIKKLVIGNIDFVVIDKKSDEDITRCILLQVISEQEQNGHAILSQEFLAQVIRSYGGDDDAIEHPNTEFQQFQALRDDADRRLETSINVHSDLPEKQEQAG